MVRAKSRTSLERAIRKTMAMDLLRVCQRWLRVGKGGPVHDEAAVEEPHKCHHPSLRSITPNPFPAKYQVSAEGCA